MADTRAARWVLSFSVGGLLALGVVLCFPKSCWAQDSTAARVDSLLREARTLTARADSLLTASNVPAPTLYDLRLVSVTRQRRATVRYGAALGAGLLANSVYPFDRDPGGYKDQPFTRDKYDHLRVAMLLSQVAAWTDVPPKWNVALTCAAATGFEFTQGKVSYYDIGASCLGSVLGVGLQRLQKAAVGR